MNARERLRALSPDQKRQLLAWLRQQHLPAGTAAAPVSVAQERAWALSQREIDRSRANICAAVSIPEAAVGGLHAALGDAVAHHEMLRTGFMASDGHGAAFLVDRAVLHVGVVDLRSVPEPQRAADLHRLTTEDLLAPFDLSSPPLFRLKLLMLDGGAHLLFLCGHEIVADQWSLLSLLQDIVDGATARAWGREPERRLYVEPFSAIAREERSRAREHAPVDYWRARLSGAPAPAPLPASNGRTPADRSVRGGLHVFTIPPDIVARLRTPGADPHGSLLPSLLATYAVLVAQKGRAADVVVGIPVLNRDKPEHQRVVGPLASHVPIRFDLSRDPSFADLQWTAVSGLTEAPLPAPALAELVSQVAPERTIDRDPLFRCTFLLQELNGNGSSANLRARASWQPVAFAAPHDLALMVLAGEEVVCRVEYAADLFDATTIAQWFIEFVELLGAMSQTPDRAVSTFAAQIATDAQAAPRAVPVAAPEPPRSPAVSPAPAAAIDAAPRAPVPSPATAERVTPPVAAAVEREHDATPDAALIEQVLAIAWRDVLKTDSVSPTDNFLEVGGHSLLAMQVHSILIEALGFEAPLRLQFEAPTLADLARDLLNGAPDHDRVISAARRWLRERGHAVPAAPSAPPAQTRTSGHLARARVAPVSFAQERIWFLDQFEPGSPFYTLHFVLDLPGHLNRGALERALSDIVGRHEALRTTFSTDERGAPIQVVQDPSAVHFGFDDLRVVPNEDQDQAVKQILTADIHVPFDLSTGPLLRPHLLRVADNKHLLIIVMHHIIVDAWSLNVLIRELQALYQAYATGRPAELPPLPLQYPDYARRQREALQGPRLDRLLAYWKQQLAGAPALLALPTDRPRPALQSFSGALYTFDVAPDVAERILSLGRTARATPFMVLLAAFAAVLARHANQHDVVVGSPIINRQGTELEPLIGLFSNTLVLRFDVSGHQSFIELLSRVRAVTIEAYDHQDLPFERLVDAIQPERRLNHSPLFQVLFSFDVDLQASQAKTSGTADPKPQITHTGTAKFDLGLYMFRNGNSLGGGFEYNTDLFDQERIERMAGHLKTLLAAVAANPDAPLSRVEILAPAEHRQLLAWSRAKSPLPAEACTHELFSRQAELVADRPAVRSDGVETTFGELDAAANRLAHYLRQQGVGLDSRVGLSVDRSLSMLVGLVGILKAGAAYVPIDPEYPRDRIVHMLRDAEVATVVTQSWIRDRLPLDGVSALCLDQLAEALRDQPVTAPDTGVGLDNLAYTIYTSGSTGLPKGVAMTHRAVADLVTWQARQPYFGGGGRTLQFTSLSFDVSFQEIFSTWIVGGCVVVITEEQRRDPEQLARIICDEQIRRVFQPFVGMQQLCDVLAQSQTLPTALRHIITAGEQVLLTPAIARTFSRLPSCRLFNQYGPSETHIVTEEPVLAVARGEPSLPPIGRPIAASTAYVLDEQLRLQPVGVPGDLYIGGSALARGYLNQPGMTAVRFVPDPFAGVPGARMYRTGDVARLLPNGSIQFEGRHDDQVKIRGFRVEPGEVETVLRRHPHVSDGAVVARRDPSGEKRLVAYYVSDDSDALTAPQLRDYLREQLPDYMVPSTLVRIAELPLTASGKINRRALPDPDFSLRQAAEEWVAPRNAIETALTQIFKTVLSLDAVGVHDNFFDLGGHSLLATRVVSSVRSELGVRLSVRVIFETQTVEALAALIMKLQHEHETPRLAPAAAAPDLEVAAAGVTMGGGDVRSLSPVETRP